MYPSRGNQPRSLFQIRYPNGVRPSASRGHRADRTIMTTKKPVRMSSQATLPSACFRLWPRSLTSPMTNPIARWTYAARMERTMKSVICSSFSSGAWSAILGVNIPLHAPLEKLEQITDFIVLSILAAYVHLAIGFVIGLVNDLGHSRKHALGKVAWLLILTGFFVVMIVRSARWPFDAEGRTPFGYLIWNKLLGWFPREGYVYAQIGFVPNNPIPWAAIGMLLGGVGLLLATEGPLHIMEFFGLLANIVSYARLAAVGVAKAAMAFAFNVIVLETMIFPAMDSGNLVTLVLLVLLGFLTAFVFH